MKNAFSTLVGSSILATGFALTSSLIAPNSAQAFSISFDGSSHSTNNNHTGASALVDFNFSQSEDQVVLDLNITNTTNTNAFGDGATQSTLVGFGFDLLDSISSFDYNQLSSPFAKLYEPAQLGNYTFDVGIRSAGSGNFAGGNPQAGLERGESSSVQFVLSGNNLQASQIEEQLKTGFEQRNLELATRFQQVGGEQNYSGATSEKLIWGTIVEESQEQVEEKKTTKVPEPTTTLALSLFALSTFGLMKKKTLNS